MILSPHHPAFQSPANGPAVNGSTNSSNRMLFNFHPGLNPSQESEPNAVKKQTSEKDVVFIAGGSGSTSPQHHQTPVHPSLVPSLLSSFANSPNNGSQSNPYLSLTLLVQNANWHSSAGIITSQQTDDSAKAEQHTKPSNRNSASQASP